MLGHGAKFRQKMEQAIAALLSHKSIEDAARAVGIGTNTLQRWMKDPEFDAELRKARRRLASHAVGRLQEAAGAAISVLLKIMMDTSTPAAIRVRAIEIVLDQGAKAATIGDLEDRVAKLERSPPSAEITWLSSALLPDGLPGPAQIAAPGSDVAEAGEEVVE